MAVDAIEHATRKDDVVTGHLGEPVEGDDRLRPEAELLRLERHDLAAIHIPLAHERGDVLQKRLRHRLFRRHHLDARAAAPRPHVLVGTAHERDERRPVHLHEIEAELDDREDAVAVEVEVHPVDGTLSEAEAVRRRAAADEIREPETPVALVLRRESDELRAVANLLEIRVHRDLEVRLLEALDLLGDHRHARRFATEVLAKALQQRAFGDLRAIDDVVEKTLEEKSELLRRRALIHRRDSSSSRATERALRGRRRESERS